MGGGKEEFDKKTRDLIGENLIDIENTLKALNLDFMQTYNELEKTDSAETLFGDANYTVDKNPKIRNSAIKLSKLYDLGNFERAMGEKVSNRRSQTPEALSYSPKMEYNSGRRSSASPQEKSFSPRDMKFSMHGYVNLNRENTVGFGKGMSASPPVRGNYSSNNSIHTLMQMYTSQAQQRLMMESEASGFPHRKRSMSFTENYDLKSPTGPVGTAPAGLTRGQTRLQVGNKSKSAKARTLRRLSYNPIVLDSSSSSSSESEFDRSIAHSECDIRTKMLTSRRRKQYLNRKSASTVNPDKLYGSNTSIKSAPQYNYSNGRGGGGEANQARFVEYGEEFRQNIYDYGNGGGGYQKFIQPPRKYITSENSANYPEREFLYPPEFDVSKLTGKSPTTQGFFAPPNGAAAATTSRPPFQWPEKIHASTVKRNDLLWRQRQERNLRHAEVPSYELGGMAQSFSSDSSSSTETDSVDFQHGEFPPNTRMPPSPAP